MSITAGLTDFISRKKRTLVNPKMRLMTRNACSTLARTLDFVVFFAHSAFESGWFRLPLWWVKSRALRACALMSSV